MLETIREFGLERLDGERRGGGDAPPPRGATSLALAERAEPDWLGAGQAGVPWPGWSRAATTSAPPSPGSSRAGETGRFARLAGGARPVLGHPRPAGRRAGGGWSGRWRRADAAPSPALAKAWLRPGSGCWPRAQGDHGRAAALEEKSLVVARATGDARAIADALHSLGQVVVSQGDYGRAAAFYEEALALYRGLGGSLRGLRPGQSRGRHGPAR